MASPRHSRYLTPLATVPTYLQSRRDVIRHGAAAIVSIGFPSTACAQADFIVDRFTDIPRCDVPATAKTLLTRGWRTPGIGGGPYVFDPCVDGAWVRRYPRSSAISSNGRGFRLDGVGGDVRQYGAIGDGRTDDTAAINEALSRGGTVTLTGPATYVVTDRLLLPIARTRLLFGEYVTLQTRVWHYQGSQTPFGNAVHVTGDDCEVIGTGPTSILQNVHGDANGVGFLNCGGGRIARLTLNGGKHELSAVIDDTFQSGISIVNDRANNPGKRPSHVIIEDCLVVDWMQYGINVYGDLASEITIRRTTVVRSGKSDDRQSVGAGIVLTRGAGPVLIDDNTISDNKGFGILISSAGAEIHDITVSHNQIVGNGMDGIRCSEERHYSGVGDIGQRQIMVRDNGIKNNGGMGVRVGTYDGVGSIRQLAILRNRITGNRGSGVLLQANDAPGRGVDATIEKNEFIANGDYGMALGLNLISLRHNGNRFEKNHKGATVDHRSGTPHPLVER